MAEYYPLLAKAVGSLSNSTPESRRVVYERARKALIGQLRTLHPPVPDEDIDRESEALDRAVERLESELATGTLPAVPPAPPSPPAAGALASASSPMSTPSSSTPPVSAPPLPAVAAANLPKPPMPRGSAVPSVDAPSGDPASGAKPPVLPLRGKLLGKGAAPGSTSSSAPDAASGGMGPAAAVNDAAPAAAQELERPPLELPSRNGPRKAPRGEGSRPIAPQPSPARGPKRRLWIIPVAVILVVGAVAYFAWKLRDRPETIAIKTKPAEQTQADTGKIAERVGGSPSSDTQKSASAPAQAPTAPPQTSAPGEAAPQTAATPAPNNPELPVAHRAALLVEAPNEPNKVKTFLGTVVWKLNNVPQGPNDAVGLAVEADIEIPDDKMKAVVTFAKNTEASLPASHTINVRYTIESGSYTGDVKQISVPQMRPEASASGEPLAGVTVQIVPNSFLVGLSPGNAEAANTDLLRRLQWVDIPMLLDNGKIAKLTFEKSDSGQRDLTEALDSWQKN